jgi:predicted dehydrogenase
VLVGCGAMSRAWLEAARQIDGLTIAGLVDLEVDRAKARAAEFGLADAAIGADVAEVLRRTESDIVFDVVVPAARRDLALTAFDHGCHLLTEKPMADTLGHARDIIAAARAADRIHAVVQNRRYHPAVRRIRRLIESGAIGEVTSLHSDFFIAPHFGGFREEMDHVLLVDMAIHTFDAARYMADRAPVAVYCHEWDPPGSWYRQGASAAAIFELAGGVVVTYRGSWCANGLRTSWDSDWRIVGTRGSILWDGDEEIRADIASERGEPGQRVLRAMDPIVVPPLWPEDRIGGHLGVMQDFVSAVVDGGEPETRGEDNIQSLAMVFAAIESAETGRRIEIDAPQGQAGRGNA